MSIKVSNMDTGGAALTCTAPSNQFPAGLRVLVVDDDSTCLKILEKMLRICLYEVITCSRAVVALSMLREKKYIVDLVISDVHMPDMDGFKLLEHIGLEMDLPVIMMSVDDKKEVVMKGVTHGACDYLIKPVRIEAIKNIWQHVVRKRRNELRELEQSGSLEENDRNRRASEDVEYASSVNEGSWKSSKKRKDEDDELEERDDTSTLKKPRVVWSVELHQQFVGAVNQLGIDKAVPKKILELMNVPGLTRENVASHLQKYRLYLRRLSGVSHHQNGLNPSFLSPQEANFGSMSSFDGLDLQALAVSGQLPPNSFAKLQAAGLARSAVTTSMGMQYLEQKSPFSSDASKLRFGSGQQMNNINTQGDLINGLMSVMDPKELHQSVPSLASMGLQNNEGATGYMSLPSLGTYSVTHSTIPGVCNSLKRQMVQPLSGGQLLNDISGGHSSATSLPMGQQILPNEMVGQFLPRNVSMLDGRATTYIPVSQTSSMLDFQKNHTLELPGNGFHVGVAAGVPSLQLKGMFQDRGSLDVKGPRDFPRSYSIFNEHPQCKNQEWELRNVDSTFEASQHSKSSQGNYDFCPQVLGHQGLAYNQKAGLNGNVLSTSNSMVFHGEKNQFVTSEGVAQVLGSNLLESSFKIKAESMGDINVENMLHVKHFDEDDLMSAILKQQKVVGEGENGFIFDGSSEDDVPV